MGKYIRVMISRKDIWFTIGYLCFLCLFPIDFFRIMSDVMLCGLMCLTEGTITYNGKQLNKDLKILPSVGVIINTPTFYEYLSGYENLTLLASIKNTIDDETILRVMDKVGISYAKDKMVKKYSLGMRQRLAIAQAIMEEPEVLLLDEVTNGLDKKGIEMVYQLLKEEKEKNKIVFITSHNMNDIETLCDVVYEINNQRIEEV